MFDDSIARREAAALRQGTLWRREILLTLVFGAILLAAPLAEKPYPHAGPWLSLGSGLGLMAFAFVGMLLTMGAPKDWSRNAETDAKSAQYLDTDVVEVGDKVIVLRRQRLTPPVSMFWGVMAVFGAFRLFLTIAPWVGLKL